MIEKDLVSIQTTQLNKLIKEHGGPGKPAAKPTWGMKGHPGIRLWMTFMLNTSSE
jgi:hypothetical protein